MTHEEYRQIIRKGGTEMAALYNPQTGNLITDGLQGCKTSDEAILMAERKADEYGHDVHLLDDDGEWLVHPAIDGARETADPI